MWGPPKPPLQRVTGALFLGVRDVKLITYLQLVPRSRIRGSIYPLPRTPSLHSAWLVNHRDNFNPVLIRRNCKAARCLCCLLPEVGGREFARNIVSYVPDYRARHARATVKSSTFYWYSMPPLGISAVIVISYDVTSIILCTQPRVEPSVSVGSD
jgi:hypothetical protein